jgi:hypothetical protein
MYYLLLFHGNNGYTKAPQCYVYTYTACHVTVQLRSTFNVLKYAVPEFG